MRASTYVEYIGTVPMLPIGPVASQSREFTSFRASIRRELVSNFHSTGKERECRSRIGGEVCITLLVTAIGQFRIATNVTRDALSVY